MKKKINISLFFSIDTAAYLLIFLFCLASILVSLNRYWQYDVFYHDFGIFDSAIWNVSRFKAPIIDHLLLSGKWIFADHFNPSIFLLSPLYWITDRSEVLLIAQSIIVGLSGLVLYLIGKKVIKDKLLSLSIVCCYFLFLGLQNALITDFHEVTVMSLPFMLVFWAFVTKRKFWYFFFLVLTLGFKESNFLPGIGIGITLFLIEKSWRKIALWTILLSLLWGLISIKIIIPFFSGGIYLYNPKPDSGGLHLLFFLSDNPIKLKTLFFSFFSFGFLPLLSPPFWLLILQDLIVRFLPNIATRWGLGFHYSVQIAVILSIASLYGVKKILERKFFYKKTKILAILLIFNAFFLYARVLHGPLGLAYNPTFYQHSNNFSFLDTLTRKIPKNATVMAQNNLATRFTHQQGWVLVDNYLDKNPEYIVIDMRPGQNPNNFYGLEKRDGTFYNIKVDKGYKILYHTEYQYVFQRVKK